jgi:branched-chain amino acid transport system ATP-binding protein
MNAEQQQPLLEVTGLQVSYGRIAALHGVDLRVLPGEIVTVLGANGAGKTTLMKAVAGLLPARAGSIRLRGEDITHLPAHRRVAGGVALVPEGRLLFSPLTVRENLRLGMLTAGWAGKGQLFAERLDWVMSIFPALRDKLGAASGDLSGGQQQMVAVGRALMSAPSCLLLDEPSLGLAPKIIEQMFETLLTLNEDHDLTVLLAEQNIDNALGIADRGYVLQVGNVAVTDDAETLLRRGDVEDVYLGRRSAYAQE